MSKLTQRQENFCLGIIEGLSQSDAYRAAYNTGKSSAKTVHESASRLMVDPKVITRLAELRASVAEVAQITAAQVLDELWKIAVADPNELIQLRRECCRHCYGEGFEYQRTAREMKAAEASYAMRLAKQKEGDDPIPPFDPQGGIGFDARKAPNPECDECFGEGQARTHALDTRALSPEARRLYAGVKKTADGLEIKMHDQQAALVQVGKHLGMFTDKVDVTSNGRSIAALVATALSGEDA